MNVFELAAMLTLNRDKYTQGLEEAEGEGKSFGSKLGSSLGSAAKVGAAAMTAVATASVAAGKQLYNMANETSAFGDNVDKMSQKIGISTDAYQEWDYVFQLCGTSVDNLQTGMKTLSSVITDAASGSDTAAEKLSAVGLSIDELNGMSQEQQLSAVITALQDMESGAERTSAATDLLGKSATDMAALLNTSAEATEKMKGEAHKYGMVMSSEAVSASAKFQDSLTKLQGTFSGVKNSIAADMLPGITSIMDGLSDLMIGADGATEQIENGVSEIIENITEKLPEIIEVVTAIAEAVLEEAPAIITGLADGILSAIDELAPTMATVVVELINALIAMLPDIISSGMSIITSLMTGIGDALPTMVPIIVEVITSIVQTIVDNLPLVLNAALQIVKGLAEGIVNSIPTLVAALPQLINSLIEFIVGSIPQIIQAGVDLLTSLVTNMPTIISTIVAALPDIITNTISTLLSHIPEIIQAGVDLLIALITNLPQVIADIVAAMPQIIEGIVTAVSEGISQMIDVGANLVEGLWQGIQSLAGWLWDQVSSWISGIWNGILGFFGIHSPSRQMVWVGEMLIDGLAGSIDSNGDEAVNAAEDMAEDVLDAFGALSDDIEIGDLAGANLSTDYEISASNTGLEAKIDELKDAILNMSIILDTGELVGSTIGTINEKLSEVQAMTKRGAVYA